jgi:hypothetical protein
MVSFSIPSPFKWHFLWISTFLGQGGGSACENVGHVPFRLTVAREDQGGLAPGGTGALVISGETLPLAIEMGNIGKLWEDDDNERIYQWMGSLSLSLSLYPSFSNKVCLSLTEGRQRHVHCTPVEWNSVPYSQTNSNDRKLERHP